MLLKGDYAGLSLSMREAAQETNISAIRFFTQKGLYIQRILKGLGQEGLDRDIQRLSRGNDGFTQLKVRALKQAKNLLFENVRNFVEQQFTLFAGSATDRAESVRRPWANRC